MVHCGQLTRFADASLNNWIVTVHQAERRDNVVVNQRSTAATTLSAVDDALGTRNRNEQTHSPTTAT